MYVFFLLVSIFLFGYLIFILVDSDDQETEEGRETHEEVEEDTQDTQDTQTTQDTQDTQTRKAKRAKAKSAIMSEEQELEFADFLKDHEWFYNMNVSVHLIFH
jgi:hypothetical protein